MGSACGTWCCGVMLCDSAWAIIEVGEICEGGARDEVAYAERGLGLCYGGVAFFDVGEMGKRGAGNVMGSSDCTSTVHSGFDNPV